MQITLSQLTYSYEDAPDQALAPVTATFAEGWTGIVGVNGSGKSTLLRLVCGEFSPSTGSITPHVKGVYCAQETEIRPEEAWDFALDFGGEAIRIRRILEIDDDWIWRYDTLSEGERKRLQVAVALWQNPAVLALDEPTNHVDAECRERLIEALKHYKGVGLLVSHDREMLDTLTYQCLFLKGSSAVMHPGNYTKGREQEELDRTTSLHERKNAKAELSRLQQVKTARENEASRQDARKSKRNIAKGDRDAKSRIDLAIFTGQDGKAGKRSVQMDAHIASAEKRVAEARVEKIYNADVWLDAKPSKRRVLVELSEGLIPFGADAAMGKGAGIQRDAGADAGTRANAPGDPNSALYSNKQGAENNYRGTHTKTSGLHIPHLAVGPTDHISLVGPNGAGKSTLIAEIVRQLPSDIRTVYLPQELAFSERQQQLKALNDIPQNQRGRVLSIVAQLNSDPDRLLSGELASPGETRKLMLALGILMQPQLIIMDEPTNHLDLISVEALERMLAACPCALILVSHDKRFLADTTHIRWRIHQDKKGSTLIPENT